MSSFHPIPVNQFSSHDLQFFEGQAAFTTPKQQPSLKAEGRELPMSFCAGILPLHSLMDIGDARWQNLPYLEPCTYIMECLLTFSFEVYFLAFIPISVLSIDLYYH